MSWGIDDTWTLFLDRDGVINRRILSGYVTSIEEFELFLADPKNTEEYTSFKDKLKNKARIDAL